MTIAGLSILSGLSLLSMLLILLAGVGAGFVGYAVGAASLVSYPVVLALGIPPVVANVSNTVGVVGMGIGSMFGANRELRGQRRRAAVYVLMGAVGGVFGALLLLKLNPSVFEFVVPPLILFSSLAIAFNPHGRSQVRQAVEDVNAQASSMRSADASSSAAQQHTGAWSASSRPMQPMSQDPWWIWLGMSCVSVYAGYFGAGAGTVALAVLDAGRVSPFHQINALKTIIGAGANVAASIVFVMNGVVDWPVAILLGIGCFVGGYIAPPITRRIPAKIMRYAAVAAGIILAGNLAIQTYL